MSVFEKSKFIWINDYEKIDTYAEFYTKLQIAGKSAICNISCDGDYTLFINGKYVSSNQYGDFEHYKIYDKIDISSFVHAGENDFCVLCWHFGEDSQRYKAYEAGIIFEVLENGTIVLTSDENTLARKSNAYKSGLKKRISSQLGFSFEYDATREDDWLLGKGDGFKRAVPVNKKCDFYPRPTKRLCLGDAIYGEVISEADGTFIVDLGREVVGLITLSLFASKETKINIAYGEHLEGGRVKRLIGDRDFSIDYIAKNAGNEYTNHMLRLACRYLEITTHSPVKLIKIGIIPQYYEVKSRECDFLSGADKEIYEACVRTLRLCMMEHYVDCPWREQCLYAFDSRNQMLCGYYAFENGNFEYARSNLLLLGKDRRTDGLLSICSPCGIDLTIPSFSLHYVIAICEYFEHSGDCSLIYELEAKIREIFDVFLSNSNASLILRLGDRTHWNFYDWSPFLSGSDTQEADIIINALTIIALDRFKRACQGCGLDFGYDKELCSIRAAAKIAFFDTESGFFVLDRSRREPTELANSLAIIAGLCSDDEARYICEALRDNSLTSCSLSMKCFKYDAMLLCDRELYKDAVLGEIRTTYKKMIPTGTVWETSAGAPDFDGAGSLCHGWSAIPVYYYNILK